MEARQHIVSPRTLSRIGGVLYLIILVLGIFEEAFVRDRLVVASNAAATADHIRSMESVWRIGIASEFVLLICAIVLTVIFYVLLRRVSKGLELLSPFLTLVSVAVDAPP